MRHSLFFLGTSVVILVGCAELLPSTDPGTPGGGPFCSVMPDREKACYPTEAERARAYHAAVEERERPEREAAREKAQRQDAARAADFRAEQQRKQQAHEKAQADREAEHQAWAARIEAENRKKADAYAEVQKTALDKGVAVPAISAIMCSIDAEVVELRAQLEREKRVAAIGGATNLVERHRISSDIIDDTDELIVWGASLKRFSAGRLPCKGVADITKCRQNDLNDCDPSSLAPATAWAQAFDTLWASDRPHPAR